jgi:hypothetical protein
LFYVFFVKDRSQCDVTVSPRLQPEIDNSPGIEIIGDVTELSAYHLAAVFITAQLPQFGYFRDCVHAHGDLDCDLFGVGGTRFPVGDFALILVFAPQILLATAAAFSAP